MKRAIAIAIGGLAVLGAACRESSHPTANVSVAAGGSPALVGLTGGEPVTPSRLLVRFPTSGAGSGGSAGPPPVGAVMCLVHEPTLGELVQTTPYPDAIQSNAVIGCDRLITSVGRIVYNAANSPEFATFSSRFSNGVSETVHNFIGAADGNLLHAGFGGAGGQHECVIVQELKGLPPPARGNGQVCNPNRPQDLSGFVMDSIALNIEDFQFTLLPFPDGTTGVQVAFKQTWQFYGHRPFTR